MLDGRESTGLMIPQIHSDTSSKPHSQPNAVTLLPRFLFRNPGVILAPIAGLSCTFACFAFTLWLSGEKFDCPYWAIDCSINTKVQWIVANYGMVQGIVTAISGIGLASMGYAAYQLGETTLWPILHKQRLALSELDTHISASRGSIPSIGLAFTSIRSLEAFTTIMCLAIVVATQQANSFVVGHVYSQRPIAIHYNSNHSVGGGPGVKFNQNTPVGPQPFIVALARTWFNAWVFRISSEPLPKFRDYIFDRTNFTDIADFSITTVKAQKQISCEGFPLNITKDEGVLKTNLFHVDTEFSGPVLVRMQPSTAVWVDKIEYMNETRTISTLIFAAINGNIEKGLNTPASNRMMKGNVTGISAVACAVDVTLIDDQLVGDSNSTQIANVSSLNTTVSPYPPDPTHGSHGDQAAWLGVAITTFGVNIQGAQPMFASPSNNQSLPEPRTRRDDIIKKVYDNWTIGQIEEFISIGSGALGMAFSRANSQGFTIVQSTQGDRRLDPSKPYLLLYLAAPLLAVLLVLSAFSVWVHCNEDVPCLNTANVTQIIVSSRAVQLPDSGHDDVETKEKIGKMKVGYRRLLEGPAEFGLYGVHPDLSKGNGAE